MQKIKTCLWFEKNAEEAARYYVSLFKSGKILSVNPVVTAFEIEGNQFIALNGGPHDSFNDSISISVDCANQAEVDELWEKLSTGGAGGRCGWLKDKYGVSWQIVPTALPKLMNDPDPKKSQRVMQAMLKMNKLDIAELERAANQQA